ncbi:G5 domain-containing protein [Kribbella sp. HUAS MG21]|uniref:G5 domain-containing protein n=1 Tax=Kribbella sp. HUAS MG21 TaxID=3160966 RepID=A0AAU7THY2_9ACTN
MLFRAVLVSAAVVVVAGCGGEAATPTVGAPSSVRVATAPTTSSTPAAVTPVVTPERVATPTVAPRKVVRTTTAEVVEFAVIPFKKRTVTDDSLAKGERKIRTAGVDGTRRLTYRVTSVDGVRTAKKLIRQEVAKEPRTQVTVVGTKVEEPEQSGGCDPNYSGCVPIASDVDCSGGSGNGPEYVAGPVRVIGSDVYRLDSDDDGIACED